MRGINHIRRQSEVSLARPMLSQVDIRELIKQEIYRGDEKKVPNKTDNTDQYVLLDSFEKIQDSAVENGEFKWNFMVQGVTSDQVIGIRDEIDLVQEIQIGEFSLPILSEVPYKLLPPSPSSIDQLILSKNNTTILSPILALGQYPIGILPSGDQSISPWICNPYTQLPYFGKFTIQIAEAGLQSYSDGNGARHHFEFSTKSSSQNDATNPNFVTAQPIKNWDTYKFYKPIRNLHSISLIFRNPDTRIRFYPDCYYGATIEVDSNSLVRIYIPNHNLNAGDRIFIKKVDTRCPILDTYLNRSEGHVLNGDPTSPLNPGILIPTNYLYTDPAIDISALTTIIPQLPQVGDVYIAKRRIRIPMRFKKCTESL